MLSTPKQRLVARKGSLRKSPPSPPAYLVLQGQPKPARLFGSTPERCNRLGAIFYGLACIVLGAALHGGSSGCSWVALKAVVVTNPDGLSMKSFTAPKAVVLPNPVADSSNWEDSRNLEEAKTPVARPTPNNFDAIAQAVRVNKMRVYTYPLPSKFNSDFFLSNIEHNDRMIDAERRMHELFLTPGIATSNPEAADLFYVPIYPVAACAHYKASCKTWNERPDCAGCKQGYTLMLEAISHLKETYKYLEMNNGRDHIFPFFYDHGVCMETFSEHAANVEIPEDIRESIFLSHLGDDSTQCYRSNQDVVLQPFVSDVSFASSHGNKKDIFMYFRGNTRLHKSSPKTRKRLVELYKQTPGNIVTDEKVNIQQMHAELERSTFCLLPAGFAPWSYRTVEAINFECIPVFFDSSDLPFSSVIDYDKLAVVELGGEDALPALLKKLRGMSGKEIEAKQDYIRKVKPIFSYYSAEFKQALMYELSLRTPVRAIEAPKPTHNFPVDVVYTWVNGTDPAWLSIKRDEQRKLNQKVTRADSTNDMRFRDREELRYSLRSLKKNAPWVRYVHIVVAGDQKPAWANIEHPMLKIVRHEDIFPNQAETLPTYNSFAIESFVDQIPGLSENFVMMNDDFFIGKPIEKSKFFTFEGYPKVAFQDDWFQQGRICRDRPTGTSAEHSYLHAAMNSYRLADAAFGHEERSLIMHQAYPLTKSLYAKAKHLFPDAFKATSMKKFRSTEDVIPYFLALFTGFHDGTAIKLGVAEYPTNGRVAFENNMKQNKKMIKKFEKQSYELFFINDQTTNEVTQEEADALATDMKALMATMFPDPSDFELIDSTTGGKKKQRKGILASK